MASVKKVKNKNVYRAYIRRCGIQKSKVFRTRTEADKWAAEIEASILNLNHADDGDGLTFREVMMRYQGEITPTKKGARREINRINQVIGLLKFINKPITKVTPSDISGFRNDRIKVVSASTVIKELALLSHIFEIARTEFDFHSLVNVVKQVRKPYNNAKERDQRISDHQLKMIVENTMGDAGAFIMIAIRTGMRRSELFNLKYNDIKDSIAHLHDTKNNDRRLVPLSDESMKIIESLERKPDGKLWKFKIDFYTRQFSIACGIAGIKNLKLHDCRHELISTLFENDFGIMEVAQISGHKSLSMLKRYTHLQPKMLLKKINKMRGIVDPFDFD